jgi:hypothetical protein
MQNEDSSPKKNATKTENDRLAPQKCEKQIKAPEERDLKSEPLLISENHGSSENPKEPPAPYCSEQRGTVPGTPMDPETKALVADLEAASEKLAKLEDLIGQTFSSEIRSGNLKNNVDSTHQHFHSGNRLWNDKRCPICQSQSKNNEKNNDLIQKIEKENDLKLLSVSLQAEQTMLAKEKVLTALITGIGKDSGQGCCKHSKIQLHNCNMQEKLK